jgi:Zn-dependent protease
MTVAFIIPLIIAITMHEAMHGFVAYRLGDDTAKRLGRVTFNPFRHMELFGTFIFPGLLMLSGSPFVLGWAKPVPVDFRRLRDQRRGTFMVALAGPATNVFLALLSALALNLERFITPEQAPFLFASLYASITVNVILATFNMLPILPLDGGRVFGSLLPRSLAIAYAHTERFGMAIILLLFMLPAIFGQMHMHSFNPSYYLIYIPADTLRDLILHMAGIGNK